MITLEFPEGKLENKHSKRILAFFFFFFFLHSSAVQASSPNVQQQMTWLNSLFYKKVI